MEVRNYKASSVLKKLFEGQHRVKRLDVEHHLHKLLKDNKIENVDLCVRLWICLVLTSFIIPDSSCAIPTWMLRYLDDINKLPHYIWAQYTYDVNNLKFYCLGCSWALLVSIHTLYSLFIQYLIKLFIYSTSLSNCAGLGV